jgi:hypothetical protein
MGFILSTVLAEQKHRISLSLNRKVQTKARHPFFVSGGNLGLGDMTVGI